MSMKLTNTTNNISDVKSINVPTTATALADPDNYLYGALNENAVAISNYSNRNILRYAPVNGKQVLTSILGEVYTDFSSESTFSLWFKLNSAPTASTQIFVYKNEETGCTIYWYVLSNQRLAIFCANAETQASYVSTVSFDVGTWYHIAGLVTPFLNAYGARTFINGVKYGNTFVKKSDGPEINKFTPINKSWIVVGANGTLPGSVTLDADFSDFSIFSRGLTDTEVINIYNDGMRNNLTYNSNIYNAKQVMLGTGSGAVQAWPSGIANQLGLEYAKNYAYRIAFVGSSTTQGYNQTNNETYVHLATTRFLRHVLGADASAMKKQTTGTLTYPSDKGFHFLNAGLGGTTSANYLDSTKKSLVSSFSPSLIVHMIGSNDYSTQMSLATYKSNVTSAINSFPNAQHILVHSYRRTDRADTGITWAQYGQVLREISNEKSNVFFVDASTDWETKRNGATDWMQADNIHSTWKGSQELAEIVCDKIGLEKNIGKVVWAMDATENTGSSGNIPPTSDSLVQLNAISPASANYINYAGTGMNRYATLNNSGTRYADTAAWGAAFAFPMCFFIVVNSEVSNSNGTAVKPFFSRSNNPDDGWWWAWKDNGSDIFYSALNSAYAEQGMAYANRGSAYILGVQMTPNNRAAIYVNSSVPIGYLDPDRVTELGGAWMKSLRIGANSSLSSFSNVSFKEFRFELGDYAGDHISKRMKELGTKHNMSIIDSISNPIAELNPFIWLDYKNASLANAGSSTQTPTVAAGTASKVTYSNGSAYYNGVSHRVNSMPTNQTNARTIGCWYKSSTSNSGYRSFIHVSDTANTLWELYIGYNGNKIIMGCQIDNFWADLTDSLANINDGNWHFITAEVVQRISPTTTWDMKLRVDDRVFTKTLTGRSSSVPKVNPMFIGSDRTLTPLLSATWLDDVFYANKGFSDEAHRATYKNWSP